MDKKTARILYKQKRQDLTSEQILAFSFSISEKVLPLLENKEHIHLFLPMEKFKEINTYSLADKLIAEGKKIYTSRVTHGALEHICLGADYRKNLKMDDWGVPTLPKAKKVENWNKIDVVLIPLLISDNSGYRVGYGKGMYDQFLSQCSSKTKKIGVNYFNPIAKIMDVWEEDVKLDFLITPTLSLEY